MTTTPESITVGSVFVRYWLPTQTLLFVCCYYSGETIITDEDRTCPQTIDHGRAIATSTLIGNVFHYSELTYGNWFMPNTAVLSYKFIIMKFKYYLYFTVTSSFTSDTFVKISSGQTIRTQALRGNFEINPCVSLRYSSPLLLLITKLYCAIHRSVCPSIILRRVVHGSLFLGHPTRRSVYPTQPVIADKMSDPTRPVTATRPFSHMYFL